MNMVSENVNKLPVVSKSNKARNICRERINWTISLQHMKKYSDPSIYPRGSYLQNMNIRILLRIHKKVEKIFTLKCAKLVKLGVGKRHFPGCHPQEL